MKKLLALALCILLLSGCAETFDGPTVSKPMLTEYTVDHYYAFFDTEEVHYTNRTVYAYDIYGNQVRSMEYRDGELKSVTNMKHDDWGNEISYTTWDHSGWLPKLLYRIRRTYDERNRLTAYETYDFWGRLESASRYVYDDEKGIRTCLDEQGDILQTTWYDAQGNNLRQTAGEYETVYEYDDRGNQTGWVCYKNGELYDRYEARYDDQNRQIWGGRYDADGNLKSQFDYIYDDSVYTRTVPQADGSKRIEYYHADGRPHMIENYNSEGKLSTLQRYYYQDILIPAKEE